MPTNTGRAIETIRQIAECNGDAFQALVTALNKPADGLLLIEAEQITVGIRQTMQAMDRLGKRLANLERIWTN